jgi:hypothetical protein
MSTFFGADVAELRQLATTFDNAATQLTKTRNSVGGNVQSSPWTGPDASRFRSNWDSQSATQLAAAADRLSSAATSLRKNADQQENASSVTGLGSTGGSNSILAMVPSFAPPLSGSANVGPDGGFSELRGVLNSRYPGMPDEFPATMQDVLGTLPGTAGDVVNVLGIASAITDPNSSLGDKAVYVAQDGLDSFAGDMRSEGFASGDPAQYLAGVATSVIGDVVVNAGAADFSPSGVSSTFGYIAQDPGGAALAASQAVVNYLPKLASDFWPFG